MPPLLDIRTLVLIYVGLNVGQALVLLYLWSVQRNYPPARDWALGSLMFAFGLFLFALRNQVSPVISEIASNFFLLPGLVVFNFGVVKATGRHPSWAFGLFACLVAICVLTWFSYVRPLYAAAVVTQNLVFLIFHIFTAYSCFSAKTSKGNHTFRFVGVLFVLLSVACVWRVAGGVCGITFSLPESLPRLVWIATSLICAPMISVLLTLHTSQRLQEEIHAQARRDSLTDAYNRRAFSEFAEREWTRSLRYDTPLSVLSVDIDHFKLFNDQHGHQMGDIALIRVSQAAQAALRASDIWCRYGGEEFVALLPNTSVEGASAIAERLRSAVADSLITSAEGALGVSVSVGVAQRSALHTAFSEVLADSDVALYKAKAEGRNRVVTR